MTRARTPEDGRPANGGVWAAEEGRCAQDGEVSPAAFLRRAPLLDANENLVGYELQTGDDGLPETGVLSLYAALEINRVADHKLLLARIDAQTLLSAIPAMPCRRRWSRACGRRGRRASASRWTASCSPRPTSTC
jgi:hypothetical protein